MSTRYCGRFAPSPTGPLHLGSVLTAFASWLDARAAGGDWLVRIEDLDPPREQAGADRLILHLLADLGWLGDAPVLYQSQRKDAYAAALAQLLAQGLAFECRCSRSDLAKHGGVHRGACVDTPANRHRPPAIRLRVPERSLVFDDRIQGRYGQDLRATVGDFVLRRADGPYAYQLAVVVDDAAQGVTDVVRGSDLLDSTPRQIYLQQCLGLATPRYAHVPVLLGTDGQKLSKQNLAPAISSEQLRALLPQLAQWLGQPVAAARDWAQLQRHWCIDRVPKCMSIRVDPSVATATTAHLLGASTYGPAPDSSIVAPAV